MYPAEAADWESPADTLSLIQRPTYQSGRRWWDILRIRYDIRLKIVVSTNLKHPQPRL